VPERSFELVVRKPFPSQRAHSQDMCAMVQGRSPAKTHG